MVGILSDETDPMVSVMKVRQHQGRAAGGLGSTAGSTRRVWKVAKEVGACRPKQGGPTVCSGREAGVETA